MNLLFTRNASSGELAVNITHVTSMEEAGDFCGGSDDIPLAVINCRQNAEHVEGGLNALDSLCRVSSDSGADSIIAALDHVLTLTMQFGFDHGKNTQQALDALKDTKG